MSRQRHDGKRNGARQASTAPQQRRQTNKAAQKSSADVTGARKKRSTSSSPRLVIASPTTASKAAKATTPKTSAPKSPRKTRSSVDVSAATIQREQPIMLADTVSDATVIGDAAEREAAPVAQMPEPPQMPEMPEVPQVPSTPEIPEIPETPETPEMPETPDEPHMPEVPETPPQEPETPETPPERPEVPEEPERPEEPEHPENPEQPERPQPAQPPQPPTVPETPEEPTEPVTPGEPDNPAVRAPEDFPHDERPEPDEPRAAETTDAPVVPIATERRMPTLATMSQRRRKPTTEDLLVAPTRVDERSQQPDVTDDVPGPADSSSSAKATDGSAPQQEASVVTRPVSARYSNRRGKTPRAPDLVWSDDPRLAYLPWPLRHRRGSHPQPLPPADVLIPLIVIHIFVMALLGLVGALLGLNNQNSDGSWALAGAAIVGMGGAVAYVFSESARLRRFAPHVLVVSQLALLVWSLMLFGPRASLLALAPALVEVMLLMGSTWLASAVALGSLLIYALFAGLSLGVGINPVTTLDPRGAVMLDVLCVVFGLLLALWLLLAIQSGRERAQAIARARRHEADVLRNLVTRFRQEAQDETGKLEAALLQALKGHGIDAIPAEGMYRLLAETIMDTASRLEVLRRDREERLRLEGALRVIVRAVEREWLGLDAEWPASTGTAIDELIALLRTPRLHETYRNETRSPSITPRLIPIPTVAVERDTPPPMPVSRPLTSSSWLAPRRRARRPDLYPLPSPDDNTPDPDHTKERRRNSPPLRSSGAWPAQDDE